MSTFPRNFSTGVQPARNQPIGTQFVAAKSVQRKHEWMANALKGQIAFDESMLQCFFTRIVKSGNPAVLARINIYLAEPSTYSRAPLLSYAAEMNVRLPRLKVGVCTDIEGHYFLSLHTLSRTQISPANMSHFLSAITADLEVFFTYAKIHNIEIKA